MPSHEAWPTSFPTAFPTAWAQHHARAVQPHEGFDFEHETEHTGYGPGYGEHWSHGSVHARSVPEEAYEHGFEHGPVLTDFEQHPRAWNAPSTPHARSIEDWEAENHIARYNSHKSYKPAAIPYKPAGFPEHLHARAVAATIEESDYAKEWASGKVPEHHGASGWEHASEHEHMHHARSPPVGEPINRFLPYGHAPAAAHAINTDEIDVAAASRMFRREPGIPPIAINRFLPYGHAPAAAHAINIDEIDTSAATRMFRRDPQVGEPINRFLPYGHAPAAAHAIDTEEIDVAAASRMFRREPQVGEPINRFLPYGHAPAAAHAINTDEIDTSAASRMVRRSPFAFEEAAVEEETQFERREAQIWDLPASLQSSLSSILAAQSKSSASPTPAHTAPTAHPTAPAQPTMGFEYGWYGHGHPEGEKKVHARSWPSEQWPSQTARPAPTGAYATDWPSQSASKNLWGSIVDSLKGKEAAYANEWKAPQETAASSKAGFKFPW